MCAVWKESKPEILIALRYFFEPRRIYDLILCVNARLYKMPINLAESVFVIFRPPPTHAHWRLWEIIYVIFPHCNV